MSDSHGNTPAAWSAVTVCLIGFLIGSVGLMFDPVSYPVFWVGVAVVVLSGVLFIVMSKMGLNSAKH
ncbi:HGxxPAAW family protein [Nocardioides insulae]|uniref:HGxxPAAW family protein n=1 Tax=Nocardioides insulae TaxID=394734 RepID=UPI000419E61B|nr:HGxxPAAW family protein [Nocardioides insulae]